MLYAPHYHHVSNEWTLIGFICSIMFPVHALLNHPRNFPEVWRSQRGRQIDWEHKRDNNATPESSRRNEFRRFPQRSECAHDCIILTSLLWWLLLNYKFTVHRVKKLRLRENIFVKPFAREFRIILRKTPTAPPTRELNFKLTNLWAFCSRERFLHFFPALLIIKLEQSFK